jgi:hypothetical protein
MPLFFSDEEKMLLKGSPINRLLNKRIGEMQKDYDLLKENLKEFEDISYYEFAYHRCLASSRVFGFNIEGHKTGGMVPFLGNFFYFPFIIFPLMNFSLIFVRHDQPQKTETIFVVLRR